MKKELIYKISAIIIGGVFAFSANGAFAKVPKHVSSENSDKAISPQQFEQQQKWSKSFDKGNNGGNSYDKPSENKYFSPPPSYQGDHNWGKKSENYQKQPPAQNQNNYGQNNNYGSKPNHNNNNYGGNNYGNNGYNQGNNYGNNGNNQGYNYGQKPNNYGNNNSNGNYYGGKKDDKWHEHNKNWGSNQPKPQYSPPHNQNYDFKKKDDHKWGNNNYYGNQKSYNYSSHSKPFTNFQFKKNKGHDYWGPHGNWSSWNNAWGNPYDYAHRWGFDDWHPTKGWRRGNNWYSHPSQWSDWGGWFSFFISSGGLWGFSYDSGYDSYYSNYGNECLRLFDEDWYYGRRAVFSFVACRDYWGGFREISGTRQFENYSY